MVSIAGVITRIPSCAYDSALLVWRLVVAIPAEVLPFCLELRINFTDFFQKLL